MGLTKVTAKLANPADPAKSFEALFLVDTGVDPVNKTLKRLPAIPLK